MTGFRNGCIKLDSPREVYYPGQVILGSVVFEIVEPFQLSVLFVDYIGKAKVEWKEYESTMRNGVERYGNVDYVGREEYFNVRQVLAGGNAPLSLPPGTHTYQFSFQVPPGVPSSFSGKRGRVSYRIQATIDLMGRSHLKEELTKDFKIVAPFNLNFGSPKLKEPIQIEFEEQVGCGCFSTSPLMVRARLPVSGYCPGQNIPVALHVYNRSNVEVREIVMQITTRERYRTQHPVSEYIPPEKVLKEVSQGAVLSGVKRDLEVLMPVPEILPPNLENCGIIDVGYFFKIIIKLSGCNDDLEEEEEFCMGLIPLDETVDGEYMHPLSESLPIGPIPDIPPETMEAQKNAENQQMPGPNPGFPSFPGFPNAMPGFPNGIPGFSNGTQGFMNASPPENSDDTTKQSFYVQVKQHSYSSKDPSQNYDVGFTVTSPNNVPIPEWAQPIMKDFGININIPQANVNVNAPSAPPPSR